MHKNFIRAFDNYTDIGCHVPAPYIRKSFELDFVPHSATLSVCTPGFYELYINGKNITKGMLAPYISNPDDMCCYDEYDISDLIKEGKNAIGLILGNGFANQAVDQWDFSKASFRAPLCVSVFFEACNGEKRYSFIGDESFKVHTSPIVYDMYRYGTHYDARLEIDGWNTPDFDDSSWENARIAIAPLGRIIRCTAHPITVQDELSPISISEMKNICYLKTRYRGGEDVQFSRIDHGYLYDFGVSRSGVCKLKIHGKSGQRIVLRHGERLAEDGNFNINSIYSFKDDYEKYIDFFQTDVYILKGGNEEIFIPPFTYHGFRYVLVEGIDPDQATDSLLTFEVFNSSIRQKASFSCSDEILNTIYKMTLNADLSNFHYFPTDCPHREKNGWTGDISASAEQLAMYFDCRDSFDMWLRQLRYAQRENGELPGIVPTTGWGFDWGNGPAWDSAAVTVPYYIYKYTADTAIIRDNAEMIYRYLIYVQTHLDSEGLIAIGLGDWCQPKRYDIGILAPLKLTDSVTVFDIASKAEEIFSVIGDCEKAEYARSLAKSIKEAIRTHLIDYETMLAAGNCQTSQALLLSLGIFEPGEYEKAYARLIEIIHSDKDHIMCGVIGYRHLFDVLIRGGDADLAMKIISREDEPSYGAMIKGGATALCEAFDENGVQESQNHHFFGDVIRVFMNYLAGICVIRNKNGKAKISISPVIPSSMSYARGEIDIDGKTLCAGWERRDNDVLIYAVIPEGIEGSFFFGDRTVPLNEGYNEFII